MTVTSLGRIALPYLGLVAAGSAATVVGIHVWRTPPAETRAAAPVAMVSPAPVARVESPVAPATAGAASEADHVAAALAGAKPQPDADPSVPSFDVARIERSGEAVIAGRAAPGAAVELLRNGERLDRAVADAAGQFVMVPSSRIPAGDSELTLRATLPDGKQVTSQQSVAVALAAEPNAATAKPSAGVAERVANARAVLDQAVASSQAIEPSDGGAPSAEITPKDPTKGAMTKAATVVVTRGDSLWRISNLTYGDGVRYAVLYKANRDKIRNPNRIYPGQVFVLPGKEH
jgi:nucleoid-associated protein YgaU